MKKLAILAFSLLAGAAFATLVPKGTELRLAFDDDLTSKTARIGDKVSFRVVEDVSVGGEIVIAKGTVATGEVTQVNRGRRFGVNATVKLRLDPIVTADGTKIPIASHYKGKKTGSRTDKAAIASGAGALVLGPIGLGIGYFITGKEVHVHRGDTLATEVTSDTEVKAIPGTLDSKNG